MCKPGWRLFCEYLKEEKVIWLNAMLLFDSVISLALPTTQLVNRLDEVLPETAKFCRLLQRNCDNKFATKQLLLLARLYDFSDEAGRRALAGLLRKCLEFPVNKVLPQLTTMFYFLKLHRRIVDDVHRGEYY